MNYLIFERTAKGETEIIRAVELNEKHDQEYYWEKILHAFSKDCEKTLFWKLHGNCTAKQKKTAAKLYPGCYRNDTDSNCGNVCHECQKDIVTYAYVIDDDILKIYHYGHLLCKTNRENALLWKYLPLHSVEYAKEHKRYEQDLVDHELLYHAYQEMEYRRSRTAAYRFAIAVIFIMLTIFIVLLLKSQSFMDSFRNFFIAMY